MDVLEVEVKESEVLSLDKDLRQEFPDGGMKCQVQVPGCGDKRYSSLASHRKHWRRSHVKESFFFTVNLVGIGRLRNATSFIITIRNIKGSRDSRRKLHSTIHKYIRKACCHQRNIMPNSWRICSRRILYQSLETAIHFFSSTMMVPPRSM